MDKQAQDFGRQIISRLDDLKGLIHEAAAFKQKEREERHKQAEGSANHKTPADPRINRSVPDPQPSIAESNPTTAPEQKSFPLLRKFKPLIEVMGVGVIVIYTSVTIALWFSSAEANRIAREALKTASKSFQIEQRAWLKASNTAPSFAFSGVTITVENLGKIPALNTRADAFIEIVNNNQAPRFFVTPHAGSDFTILFPGDHQTFPLALSGTGRQFTQSEIDSFATGRAYVAIYGRLIYSDNFGKHWSLFCSWRDYSSNPNATFDADACVAFNRVGDGEPPKWDEHQHP